MGKFSAEGQTQILSFLSREKAYATSNNNPLITPLGFILKGETVCV